MYSIHATRKLLGRVKQPLAEPVVPTTFFGNWYASALTWRPRQVALFVNEATLLPVLVELAPAKEVATRFPAALGKVLESIGVPMDLIIGEVEAMNEVSFAKTASRSILGSMTDFAFLAEHSLASGHAHGDLTGLSVFLADTPCSPLHQRHTFPDREALAMVEEGWKP